jgi:hypothetical protein
MVRQNEVFTFVEPNPGHAFHLGTPDYPGQQKIMALIEPEEYQGVSITVTIAGSIG